MSALLRDLFACFRTWLTAKGQVKYVLFINAKLPVSSIARVRTGALWARRILWLCFKYRVLTN